MPPLSCSSSRSSSDRMQEVALVLELSLGVRASSCSAHRTVSSTRCSRSTSALVGVGGVEVRLVDGCDAARTRCPRHPSASTTTGRTHTSRLDTRVLRGEQDRVAVLVDVGLTDLVVALPGRDPPLDVGRIAGEVGAWLSATDRPWHSGHLSSRLQVVRTRRASTGRRSATARPRARSPRRPRARSTGPTDGSSRAPAPRRGSSRARPTTSARTSQPRRSRRSGEIANVSGCPRVAKSSAASFCGSSAIVHPTLVVLRRRLRTSPVVSSRTMPTMAKSESSACAA